MSKQGNETHICKEHLGAGCRCAICGTICHDYHSDDDGTFAASGKVVTARCARCGDEEHYYADTGVVIDHYRGGSYEHACVTKAHSTYPRSKGEGDFKMKLACLFGHRWEGCVCHRCGAKAHESSDRHKWEYLGTIEMECPLSSSRGGGQHLDPCYGVDCQFCDEYKRTKHTYICRTCGMTTTSFEPYRQE